MDWAEKLELSERTRASAGKPQIEIQIGKEFKMGTFNVKGVMKQGMREEIETYMKTHNIKILAIQETNIK